MRDTKPEVVRYRDPLPDGYIPFDPKTMTIINVYGWEGGCQREFVVPIPCGRILVDVSPKSRGTEPTVTYSPHSEYVGGMCRYVDAHPPYNAWRLDVQGYADVYVKDDLRR